MPEFYKPHGDMYTSCSDLTTTRHINVPLVLSIQLEQMNKQSQCVNFKDKGMLSRLLAGIKSCADGRQAYCEAVS